MEELVRVSQRNLSLHELVRSYKSDMLTFLSFRPFNKTNESITADTIEALLSGVPYKQAYCFERKRGGLFVLEKSCRLVNLIKYVENQFSVEVHEDEYEDDFNRYDLINSHYMFFNELPKRIRMRILRLSIPICLVEYSTAPGIQMRIASYVEELSYTQEEQVRRAIYTGRGIEGLQNAIMSEIGKSISLRMEADVTVSLTYWYNFVHAPYNYKRIDYFTMENKMFEHLNSGKQYYIHLIVSALTEIKTGGSAGMGVGTLRYNYSGMQYKNVGMSDGHLLGLAILFLGRLDNKDELVEATGKVAYCFQDRQVVEQFKNCDKSNYGVLRFINYLREKI